jgi:AcrR family transcriptional regulator
VSSRRSVEGSTCYGWSCSHQCDLPCLTSRSGECPGTRLAGLGNATLYRHFPTRSDLLVAVYADEVTALCQRGAELLEGASARQALYDWLDAFVEHVSTKRALALAVPGEPRERRTKLFDRWHESMRSTARRLLCRAQEAGTVHSDVTVDDLLALATAVALASTSTSHAQRLMRVLRHGLQEGAA